MTSFKATFWQWIPSIKRSLSLIGDGCVMDTRSIGDMRPIYSQMVPESDGKVQSVVPFYYRGRSICASCPITVAMGRWSPPRPHLW